jgi:hypothetical protein
MLMWDLYKFQKKGARTRYAELLSLQPVEYVDHVVHCGGSGARNVDALFFLLGGTGTDSTKTRSDTLC